MSNIHWPVSDEEIATAQRILAKLQPGYLPLPIFLETTRLTVASIVEIVPLRMHKGSVQVLLLKRPDNELHWPGMVHTPGVVALATDVEGSRESAFHRILDGELGGVAVAGPPRYVTSLFRKSRRGMEDAKIFFVDVVGEPTVGTFHDADELPANLVETQVEFIHAAAEHFRAYYAGKTDNTPEAAPPLSFLRAPVGLAEAE